MDKSISYLIKTKEEEIQKLSKALQNIKELAEKFSDLQKEYNEGWEMKLTSAQVNSQATDVLFCLG